MKILPAVLVSMMLFVAGPLAAQAPGSAVSIVPGNQAIIILVADYHRSMDFYHDFMGLDFAAIPQPRAFRAMPTGIDDLYDIRSTQLRNQLLRVPGSEAAIELIQFDERADRPAQVRLQDIGATFLGFTVRNIDEMLTRARNGGAEVVTPGGEPVILETNERVIFLKDPNGLFIRLIQPASLPSAESAENILGMSLGVSISDTETSANVYRDLFDMDVRTEASFAAGKMMEAAGTLMARYRRSTGSIPGSAIDLEFWEFAGIDRRPIALRSHDPGVAILRFRSRETDIDQIAGALQEAKVPIVTRSRTPVMWMGGTRIIMARDFNNLYWEFIGWRPGS